MITLLALSSALTPEQSHLDYLAVGFLILFTLGIGVGLLFGKH